ncbi:MAG: hypothetical protein FWD53_05015, partial [Phycisphaerales bacterium]|nr:hypothetical protein [Phycisphaerales bacterium]
MTQTVPEPSAVSRSVQRQSLDQIVRLSIECAAQEQQIELQHTESLDQENRTFQKIVIAQQQHYKKRRAELSARTAKQKDLIKDRYDTHRAALESQYQESQYSAARQREEFDSTLKKKLEESTWNAEAALVAVEMQADVEEKKAKQVADQR